MRNPGGYLRIEGPDHPLYERDTFTCRHCGKVVEVKPKQAPEDLGGLCKVCMGLTCPQCAGQPGCKTYEQKMEEAEERFHSRRSLGL